MKKFFNATIALALTSMLFFSCSKSDDVVVKNEDVMVKATLIAGNPQADPGTKTEIQGTTPYWSVGDAVGVTNGVSTNAQFTSSITSPSTTATFSGETVSGDLFAYYPYSTAGVGTSGASIVLPAEQNPTAASFDGRADVLVSKMFTVDPENTTVSGLQFKRLTSILKVVLKNNAGLPAGEHPTFVSLEAGSGLIGTALVNFASQSLSLESSSNKVTANYSTPTIEINGTDAAYLVVVPQTLAAGTTLTLKANTENYYIEKNITVPASGIEILEGKVTTLNIGLGTTNVTHHPVINVTSDNPMAVPYTASTGNTISYSIDYPLAGGSFAYAKDADWITVTSSTEGTITFSVAAQSLTQPSPIRTGHITLSYTDAPDVVVEINQQAVYHMPATASSSTTGISINGITWNFTAGNHSSCSSTTWTVGMKKGTNVSENMANSTVAIPFNVGNVIVSNGAKSDSGLTVNSMRIEVSSSSDFANVDYTVSSTDYAPNSSVTFTRPDNQDWTGKYFRIVYVLSHSSGKEVHLEFNEAWFTSKL